MKKFLKCYFFYYILFLYLEIIFKILVFKSFNINDILSTMVYTLLYSFIMCTISCLFERKRSFVISLIIMIIITLIFVAEAMFGIMFNQIFSLYSIHLAEGAFGFTSIIIELILKNIIVIITMIIPLIIYILLFKKVWTKISLKDIHIYILSILLVYFLTLVPLNIDNKETYSLNNLYNNIHAPTLTVKKMGLMTGFRLDLKRFLFGFDAKILMNNNITNIKRDKNKKYNEIYKKFDVKDSKKEEEISNYLNNKIPTNKNEYSGIFKDKNIIYILAEGFNSIAVDKKLTPTLYKMVNSSFIFENYYSPLFMSTTGGEFQYSLSLIPTQESLDIWKSGGLYFPYTIATGFNQKGYDVAAYHNWKYTFYKRDITMKELGFDKFIGCQNGLEKVVNCNIWPPSDIEMIDTTINDYIDKDKFVTYYITVSGHAEYNFDGNMMALKNKELVDDLEYSEGAKAYLASQIELDRALEKLVKYLKDKKVLDDTVIVLSGDHYPYALDLKEVNELSSYKRDELFEVNNSNLIIYNPKVKKTKVEKLASSVDVLPTIYNMFGIKYDSRLLMGSDIFSDHESLVIFSDNSWISEKGRFNATENIFYPKNKKEALPDDYVESINTEVLNRVNVSTNILKTNYYDKLINKNR